MSDKKEEGKGGEKKEETPLTPEEEAKKKKKKLLIMAIGGVVLVGGIGGGAAMFLTKKKPAPAEPGSQVSEEQNEGSESKPDEDSDQADSKSDDPKEAKDSAENKKSDSSADGKQAPKDEKASTDTGADGEGGSGDSAPDFGQTYAFTPFNVNLGNPLDNHYARIEVTVEFFGGPEQEGEIKKRLPQLRDAIVSVASKKSREFLLGPDGKDQLRLEIKNRLNQYMKRKIENVYITDILIE